MLQGKKTYIFAGLSVFCIIARHLMPDHSDLWLELSDYANTLAAAFGVGSIMALRAGVSKLRDTPPTA